MPQNKTAAIYLRVSIKKSKDPTDFQRTQIVENQELKLREYAKAIGWTITHRYEDEESVAKTLRPQFKAMMKAAKRHKFDVILVWSLDSFSREGIGKTCAHLHHLARHKVAFRSFNELFLDTTGERAELFTPLFALFASFERNRIVERVKAGMDRARSKGKHVGRPRLVVDKTELKRLRRSGSSIREIATALKVSPASVHRIVQPLEKKSPGPVIISESDKERIRASPADRVKVGREPKLSDKQVARARKMIKEGQAREHIALVFNVSRATLYRGLGRRSARGPYDR